MYCERKVPKEKSATSGRREAHNKRPRYAERGNETRRHGRVTDREGGSSRCMLDDSRRKEQLSRGSWQVETDKKPRAGNHTVGGGGNIEAKGLLVEITMLPFEHENTRRTLRIHATYSLLLQKATGVVYRSKRIYAIPTLYHMYRCTTSRRPQGINRSTCVQQWRPFVDNTWDAGRHAEKHP